MANTFSLIISKKSWSMDKSSIGEHCNRLWSTYPLLFFVLPSQLSWLSGAGLSLADIDLFIPHQANGKIPEFEKKVTHDRNIDRIDQLLTHIQKSQSCTAYRLPHLIVYPSHMFSFLLPLVSTFQLTITFLASETQQMRQRIYHFLNYTRTSNYKTVPIPTSLNTHSPTTTFPSLNIVGDLVALLGAESTKWLFGTIVLRYHPLDGDSSTQAVAGRSKRSHGRFALTTFKLPMSIHFTNLLGFESNPLWPPVSSPTPWCMV